MQRRNYGDAADYPSHRSPKRFCLSAAIDVPEYAGVDLFE
jgi:hypothetical protein